MRSWTSWWSARTHRTRRDPTPETLERARRALLHPGVDVAVIAQVFGLTSRQVWALLAETGPRTGRADPPNRHAAGTASPRHDAPAA